MDLNVFAICGMVFAFVGIIFVIVSAFWVVNFDVFQYKVEGDARLFIAIFAGLGIATSGIGFFILGWHLNQMKRQKKVFENGYYMTVPITDIRMDTRVRMNGRYPYVVEAQYMEPATREIYLFRSHNFFYNPANKLTSDRVDVYLIPPDYKNYYMDIDSIIE